MYVIFWAFLTVNVVLAARVFLELVENLGLCLIFNQTFLLILYLRFIFIIDIFVAFAISVMILLLILIWKALMSFLGERNCGTERLLLLYEHAIFLVL